MAPKKSKKGNSQVLIDKLEGAQRTMLQLYNSTKVSPMPEIYHALQNAISEKTALSHDFIGNIYYQKEENHEEKRESGLVLILQLLFNDVVIRPGDVEPIVSVVESLSIKAVAMWRVTGSMWSLIEKLGNTSVKTLEIMDTAVNETTTVALKRIFEGPLGASLTKVVLDHTPIGDAGAIAIAEGVLSIQGVKHFSARYCGIEAEGAARLSEAIASWPVLQICDLGANRIGPGSYALLRAVAHHGGLTHLDMTDNYISPDETFVTPCISAIQGCKTLTSLFLTGNPLPLAFGPALLEAISKTPPPTLMKVSLPPHLDLATTKSILELLKSRLKTKKKKKVKK